MIVRRYIVLSVMLSMAMHGHVQGAGLSEQPRGSGGTFVFTRSMVGTYVRTASSSARRVSFSHGEYVQPRLLPGRDTVILNSMRGGRMGVWAEDIDSDQRERICDGDQVNVSGDGRSIVLRRNGAIVRRELASGEETVVSPPDWDSCSYPSFHPDGRVLFVVSGENTDGVYIAETKRPAEPRLLFEAEVLSAPRCSPDGTTIAYQDGAHIHLFDLEAGTHRRLTFAGGVQSWPMWAQDSKRIAYLQSPTAIDGPCDVYSVALEEPRQVALVMMNVERSPDWDGMGLASRMPSTVTGDGVRFWQRPEPGRSDVEARQLVSPEGHWESLPAEGGRVKGDVLVRCEWGGLCFSAATGRLVLFAASDEAVSQQTEIHVLDGQGRRAGAIDAVEVSRVGVDEAVVSATFASEGPSAIDAAISVSRTRPLVQVRPVANLDSVFVKQRLQMAVVPDRLSNDLLYDPGAYSGGAVALPWSPLVLGGTGGGAGLVMVLAPSGKQSMALVKQGDGDAFSGIRARCGGESVFVCLMAGEGMWRRTRVELPAEEGEPLEARWSNPFAAQWRLAIQGERGNFATMMMKDTPNRTETIALEETKRLGLLPDQGISYVYGRSQNTPLDMVTPMDGITDAAGVRRGWELLDIEGVRTCRHAQEWVPYKDPRVALEILGWINTRNRPGVESRIEGACHDILLTLEGLDERRAEYDSFARELQGLCEEAMAPSPAANLMARIREQVAVLRRQLRGRPVIAMVKVSDIIQAVVKGRPGAESEVRSVVETALSERLQVLGGYRGLARRVRDRAGLAIGRHPECREACEAVRALAGRALRRRYYLEDAWRGEQPIGGPEVSYEAVSSL